MDIKIEEFNECQILKIIGEFTVKNLAEIRSQLDNKIKEGNKKFAFDFSTISIIDSSGIGLLLNFNKIVEKENGNLSIFGADKDISDILEISSVEQTIAVFPQREDFINSL